LLEDIPVNLLPSELAMWYPVVFDIPYTFYFSKFISTTNYSILDPFSHYMFRLPIRVIIRDSTNDKQKILNPLNFRIHNW
jgi:hypothetical protein